MQEDRMTAKAERRMHKARASRSVFIFVLLANAIAGCGLLPTHLHDPDRLKVAEGIRDEMAQYRANAPGMYAAMLENLERFKVEEDWLLGELAANSDPRVRHREHSVCRRIVGKPRSDAGYGPSRPSGTPRQRV